MGFGLERGGRQHDGDAENCTLEPSLSRGSLRPKEARRRMDCSHGEWAVVCGPLLRLGLDLLVHLEITCIWCALVAACLVVDGNGIPERDASKYEVNRGSRSDDDDRWGTSN